MMRGARSLAVGFLGNDLLFRCFDVVDEVGSCRSRCDGILSVDSALMGELRLGKVFDPNTQFLGVFGGKAEVDNLNG
jgi:hypothetical protein